MDTWEYAFATVNMDDDKVILTVGALPRVESDDMLNYLNRAGEQGWEVFAFLPAGATLTRLMFKRRMVDNPQAETPDF
jgi:hypothetical protein